MVHRDIMSSASSTKTNKATDVQPIRIDPELHRQLKIRCAELRSTMRDFVEQLIRQALDERKKS